MKADVQLNACRSGGYLRQVLVVDSHFHLADPVFDADLLEVVTRARAAGLQRGLCVLTAGEESEASGGRRLAQLWPEVCFAVGVHPHVAGRYAGREPDTCALVRAAIRATPRARAVGEIGLDYHYDFSPRDVQRVVFAAQVRLACELGLPVVIHMREATEDTLAILREAGQGDVRGVFHCYSGDAPTVRRILDLGFFVSFAGIVTFPRAEDVREAARVVPADRLLVETDAPYLAPVPHRGKRNEPSFVAHTVEALARVRGETAAELAERARRAFDALFGPHETGTLEQATA